MSRASGAEPAAGAGYPQPVDGYPTSLGTSDAESIRLLGRDVAGELMGTVGFGELAFWLVTLRRPTPGQVRVFEAVLVALAAGLLGGGSRFLGVTEDSGRFLAAALAAGGDRAPEAEDVAGWDALALQAVREARAAGRLVPGLGHPVHTERDPRTAALYRIAAEEDLVGPHLRLFEAVGRVHPQVLGRRLPLNGAGVCGAALADLGLPVDLLRGFALLARTAGLLGQLAEERRHPIGGEIYRSVDSRAVYQPPEPGEESTWPR